MPNDIRKWSWLSAFGIVLSAGAHLVTFVALGAVRIEPSPARPKELEFSVVTELPPEPVPLEPVPAPEPEPEPEPVKVVKAPREAAPRPVEKADPKTPEPPAAAEETIADFSGTTLTGEGAGGWASAVGNNQAMTGPIGKPNVAVTGRNRPGVEGGVVGGTGVRVVSESDLTRRPNPPNGDLLNAALERNYPKSAKQQGIEGVARIKLRVLANGKVQALATISETYPGFAEACKTAMRDMSWTPGLDQAGQPVATDIPFKCEFLIE